MSRRARWLRGAALLVALGLGAYGAWLVVTATTVRMVRVGTLAGLWGLLIGAFASLGLRGSPAVETGPHADSEDAALLADTVRREVRTTITRELALVRAQIASLRSDVLDRIGNDGEIESTEKVRLVGSDRDAGQQRLRQVEGESATRSRSPRSVEPAAAEESPPAPEEPPVHGWRRRMRGRHLAP